MILVRVCTVCGTYQPPELEKVPFIIDHIARSYQVGGEKKLIYKIYFILLLCFYPTLNILPNDPFFCSSLLFNVEWILSGS